MRKPELLTGILLIMIISSCTHDPLFSESKWLEQVKRQRVEELYAPHRQDGRFFNPWLPVEHGGFLKFLKWKLLSEKIRYTDEEKSFRPKVIPGLMDRIRSRDEGDFISWVGHNTFLIRLHGKYWLTDPIFSERALLPKRVTPPALTGHELQDLAGPLNVIISHNHYDHLDAKSIRSLPVGTRFFVPLGLKSPLQSLHPGEAREMDWWDSVDLGEGSRIVCLPAQHWSRRLGQAVNTTLWASFILITPTTTIYFGGDSGSFVGYKEFGSRFPSIDYALLPTTAFHPRWFMHYAHMNIPEALNAFEDLGARWFIPTQWGTFPLGDEPPGYPALDLKRNIQERNLDPSRFLLMDIGEVLKIQKK